MHGQQPEVSVIVPVYNTIRYVEDCVRSVMAQTLGDIEILIVDDGSDDGSEAVCDRLADEDPRIRVLHKENAGSAAARNDGIEMAGGKYIAFVESDDAAEPELYACLVSAAEKTGADIVKCDYFRVVNGNKKWEKAFDQVAAEGEVFRASERPNIFMRHASIWAGLYRRDFLISRGIRFVETPAATYSDFSYMAMTYAMAEGITVIHAPLYDYSYDNPASSRVRQGEKCCYKPYHCMVANRMLRETGVFEQVKEEIGYQEYRTCLSHARMIRSDVERQYFLKTRELFQDLVKDGFTFRRFRSWEKGTMQLVLSGREAAFYRRARLERRALTLLNLLEGDRDLTGKLKCLIKKDS